MKRILIVLFVGLMVSVHLRQRVGPGDSADQRHRPRSERGGIAGRGSHRDANRNGHQRTTLPMKPDPTYLSNLPLGPYRLEASLARVPDVRADRNSSASQHSSPVINAVSKSARSPSRSKSRRMRPWWKREVSASVRRHRNRADPGTAAQWPQCNGADLAGRCGGPTRQRRLRWSGTSHSRHLVAGGLEGVLNL